MRTTANAVMGLLFLAPLGALAAEKREFPPLPPLRVGPHEFRISTAKRGLSMLPTTRPAPPPIRRMSAIGGGGGLGGIGGGGGLGSEVVEPLEKPQEPDQDARETKVQRNPDLKGAEGRAQDSFAELFPRADPSPQARTDHYDWLPYYEDHPVHNLGWRAVIKQVEPDPDGGWRITVHMYPRLVSMTLRTHMLDYVEETYRLEGETLRLLMSDAETPKPRQQVFPTHF